MTPKDTKVTAKEQNPPAPIIDRYQLETEADIDQYNEHRRRQMEANVTSARHRADRAAVARHRLTQAPDGAEVVARTEAIRSGIPDRQTVALVNAITDAERRAAALAEGYVREVGWVIEALHHCLPFAAELQKLAVEARYRLAGLHMAGSQGQLPTATTVNGSGKNLLTHVTVYSTSRPSLRWVLDDATTLSDVVAEIQGDTHCDCSAAPFAKSLAAYLAGKPDCIVVMAEHAAMQRRQHDYWANELKTVALEHRDKCQRPQPVSVGLLFPVAFGSDVLVLKLCHGHAIAFAAKYGIQLRECGIEEPWESVGNHW